MTQLRTMTEIEFQRWRAGSVVAYGQEKVKAGQWPQDDALRLSSEEHDRLLPLGLATPNHELLTIIDDRARSVGILWFATATRFEQPEAYVYDIAVAVDRQQEGHALNALRLLEDIARSRQLCGIALHVFGHNTAARALYEKLAYAPTHISLFKPLA